MSIDKFMIRGGKPLKGEVQISGAKNAALKVLVAACLTNEKVVIHNVPLIADITVMLEIIRSLGGIATLTDHTVEIEMKELKSVTIPLDKAAIVRTSSLFIAPLLARKKSAIIPNPGGCRLGARPIDRTVEGIGKMNVDIGYASEDGYFHSTTTGLKGVTYRFAKNTHTGTETMILAAVLAEGTTILENAAEEPEINDLIDLLNQMGGKIQRSGSRQITIEGVEKLHEAEFTISPDRIEVVTFAIAGLITRGEVFVKDAQKTDIKAFLEKLAEAHAGYEIKEDGIRFYYNEPLVATDVVAVPHPGFMTDWQAPWAALMTQANGISTVHETVFENKMGYVKDLQKMGANMKLFNPPVDNPEEFYNFNLADNKPEYFHAVKITGPTRLHNAIVSALDIRAGAAVVLAALAASGETTIHGVYKIDRGYERFEDRLRGLGADITRIGDE